MHFQTVFNYLAEAVVLVIKFDNVFENGQLHNVWPQYMTAIKLAEQNLNKFNARRTDRKFEEDDVNMLKSSCYKIENLIGGNLFQVS